MYIPKFQWTTNYKIYDKKMWQPQSKSFARNQSDDRCDVYLIMDAKGAMNNSKCKGLLPKCQQHYVTNTKMKKNVAGNNKTQGKVEKLTNWKFQVWKATCSEKVYSMKELIRKWEFTKRDPMSLKQSVYNLKNAKKAN